MTVEFDSYELSYNSLKDVIEYLVEDIKTHLEMGDVEIAIKKQILLEKCCLWSTGDLSYPIEENFKGLI